MHEELAMQWAHHPNKENAMLHAWFYFDIMVSKKLVEHRFWNLSLKNDLLPFSSLETSRIGLWWEKVFCVKIYFTPWGLAISPQCLQIRESWKLNQKAFIYLLNVWSFGMNSLYYVFLMAVMWLESWNLILCYFFCMAYAMALCLY